MSSSSFEPEGPLVSSPIPPGPAEKGSITLLGKHVRLVPLNSSHAASIYANVGGIENAKLFQYMPGGPYTDLESIKNLIENLNANLTSMYPFAILSSDPVHASYQRQAFDVEVKQTEESEAGERETEGKPTAVGIITLMNINPPHRSVEIGHVLYAPTLQRTTAATEAVYLLMKWAFDAGYLRVEWKCNDRNEPSKRAALRLGFVYEGTFRKHMVVRGRRRDTAWFSVTNEEWDGENGFVKEGLETWMGQGNFDGEGTQKSKLEEIREGLGKKA